MKILPTTGVNMKITNLIILISLCFSCAPLAKNDPISDKEKARIFSAFDTINKEVWSYDKEVSSFSKYESLLKKTKPSSKKSDVEDIISKSEMYVCPTHKSFVVCGFYKRHYNFCDDARRKIDRASFLDHF